MQRIVYSLILLLVFQPQLHAQLRFVPDNYQLTTHELKVFIGKDTVGTFKEREVFFQSPDVIELDSSLGDKTVRKYFSKRVEDPRTEIKFIDFLTIDDDVFLFYTVRWWGYEKNLYVLWINKDIVKGEYEDAIVRAGCGQGGGVSLLKMWRSKDSFGYQVYSDRKETFKYKIIPGKGLIKI